MTNRADQVVYRSRVRIERVHGIHADHCPVARSLRGAIEIRTSFELVS